MLLREDKKKALVVCMRMFMSKVTLSPLDGSLWGRTVHYVYHPSQSEFSLFWL